MEISLTEKLRFPVKTITPSVDITQIDNFSAFSAVRLAKRSFESLGFAVYEGADFEDNFCMFFYGNDRLFCDEYIKVKLGKSVITEAKREYCTDLLGIVPEADVKLLLTLCRFCSYTGDPGFPDLVLLKNGKWNLAYVLYDELSPSQKMFLLLSRLVGLDVKIVRLGKPIEALHVSADEKEETFEFDTLALLSSVLGERRATAIMDGLDENISNAENEDETDYLMCEKGKNSLFLFKRWRSQGFLSDSQLKGAIHFVMTHDRHDFEKYLESLRNDMAFLSIKGKTEDAMKRRAEYMQEKFGIGRSRSKLLLNFF